MKVTLTCLDCDNKYILKLDTPDCDYACGVCGSESFDVEHMEIEDD